MTVISVVDNFKETWPQLLAVLSATIGTVSDGMQFGWSAPYMLILEGKDTPIPISHSDITWLESIYMIGGIAGLPVTINCVKKFGCKVSILLAAFTSLIAWVLIGLSNKVWYLYVARFLTGLASNMAFVAAPMYIAEIADKKVRGFLAGVISLMLLIGILLVYSIAPYTPFYVLSIVGGAFTVIQLVSLPFMPDSPYYLLSKDKPEKAKQHLKRLRTTDNIVEELEEIVAAVKRQRSERGRLQDLWTSKSNRKAIIIMAILNASLHFSSLSVMVMNLHSILKEAESTYVSFEIAGIMFPAIMLIAALIAYFLVDTFGRKSLLITSGLSSGFVLLVLAIYFTIKNCGYNISEISWIPIVAVMLYAGTFRFGLGSIPIVMTSELFPTKVKAMGMCLAELMYVVFGLISIELYQKLIDVYYLDLPFYIFATSTILTAVFAWFYIPETKGKTLEEIQYMLKGETIPKKNSSKEIENGIKIIKLSYLDNKELNNM